MRHRKQGLKLNRNASGRKALLKGLVAQILEHESIVTTMSKAKMIQPTIDILISKAMKDGLQTRRDIARVVENKKILTKLFNEIAARYSRTSGFSTRTILGRRKGDNSLMVKISLVKADVEVLKEEKKASESKAAKPAKKEGTVTKKKTSSKSAKPEKKDTKPTAKKKTVTKKK